MDRFAPGWRRQIEGERRRIITETVGADVKGVEATLGPIEFQITFIKPCKSIAVRARYVWQVRTSGNPGPHQGANQEAKVVNVPKTRTFGCFQLGGMWICS